MRYFRALVEDKGMIWQAPKRLSNVRENILFQNHDRFMLWINVWNSDNICHYFLWHKDNRIIRELHCFYILTKIWVSFGKGQKVACITEEAGANDWIPFCLLSPPAVNSLVLFLSYKQYCNLLCNYYLTFASWLCCQNISFH